MDRTVLALLGSLMIGTGAHAAPIQPCPDGKTYADYVTVGSCLLGDKAFSNFALVLGPNTGAATIPKANRFDYTVRVQAGGASLSAGQCADTGRCGSGHEGDGFA